MRDQHNLVLAGRQFNINQRIARIYTNGDDPSFADVAKVRDRGLLDRTQPGGEEQKTFLLPRDVFLVRAGLGHDPNQSADALTLFELQEICDAAALGSPPHVGNLVHALYISASEVGKEHEVIVGAGGEQVLDEILVPLGIRFTGRHTNDAFTPTSLSAV